MPRGKGNRTDLYGGGKVAATVTAPDQAYGEQTAQRQAMKIAPVGGQPIAAPSSPGGAGPQTPTPMGGAMPGPQPGELPFLHPTTHGKPATTGLPTGPGAGPEVLTGIGAQAAAQAATEQGTMQSLLAHLSSQPGASSLVKGLAATAGVRPGPA